MADKPGPEKQPLMKRLHNLLAGSSSSSSVAVLSGAAPTASNSKKSPAVLDGGGGMRSATRLSRGAVTEDTHILPECLKGEPSEKLIRTILAQLEPSQPLASRVALASELCSLLGAYSVSDLTLLWNKVKDLIERNKPVEVRTVGFMFMMSCLKQGDSFSRLALLRVQFFEAIVDLQGDREWRLKILVALTNDGRTVAPFERALGELLIRWIMEMPVASEAPLLRFTANVIKHNSTVFTAEPLASLIEVLCDRDGVSSCRLTKGGLFISDVVVRYSSVPDAARETLVCSLCNAINDDNSSKDSVVVMRNLLQGLQGHVTFKTLLRVLARRGGPGFAPTVGVIRGAVFFVSMFSWGSHRIESINFPFSAILPAFVAAVTTGEEAIAHEVLLSLKRLITKYGPSLRAEWDIVLHVVGATKPTFPWKIRSHETLDGVLGAIDDLYEQGSFFGLSSQYFSLLEQFLDYIPQDTVQRCLHYRAQLVHPVHPGWTDTLMSLISTYSNHTRASVRCEALMVLRSVYNSLSCMYETELLDAFVPCLRDKCSTESDSATATAAVLLVVEITETLRSDRFEEMLDIVARTAASPPNEQARDSAILGVSQLFHAVFPRLPSSRLLAVWRLLNEWAREGPTRLRQGALQCFATLGADSTGSPYLYDPASAVPHLSVYPIEADGEEIVTHVPVAHMFDSLVFMLDTGGCGMLENGVEAEPVVVTHGVFRMAVATLQKGILDGSIMAQCDIERLATVVANHLIHATFGLPLHRQEKARRSSSAGMSAPFGRGHESGRSSPTSPVHESHDLPIDVTVEDWTDGYRLLLYIVGGYATQLSEPLLEDLFAVMVRGLALGTGLDNEMVTTLSDSIEGFAATFASGGAASHGDRSMQSVHNNSNIGGASANSAGGASSLNVSPTGDMQDRASPAVGHDKVVQAHAGAFNALRCVCLDALALCVVARPDVAMRIAGAAMATLSVAMLPQSGKPFAVSVALHGLAFMQMLTSTDEVFRTLEPVAVRHGFTVLGHCCVRNRVGGVTANIAHRVIPMWAMRYQQLLTDDPQWAARRGDDELGELLGSRSEGSGGLLSELLSLLIELRAGGCELSTVTADFVGNGSLMMRNRMAKQESVDAVLRGGDANKLIRSRTFAIGDTLWTYRDAGGLLSELVLRRSTGAARWMLMNIDASTWDTPAALRTAVSLLASRMNGPPMPPLSGTELPLASGAHTPAIDLSAQHSPHSTVSKSPGQMSTSIPSLVNASGTTPNKMSSSPPSTMMEPALITSGSGSAGGSASENSSNFHIGVASLNDGGQSFSERGSLEISRCRRIGVNLSKLDTSLGEDGTMLDSSTVVGNRRHSSHSHSRSPPRSSEIHPLFTPLPSYDDFGTLDVAVGVGIDTSLAQSRSRSLAPAPASTTSSVTNTPVHPQRVPSQAPRASPVALTPRARVELAPVSMAALPPRPSSMLVLNAVESIISPGRQESVSNRMAAVLPSPGMSPPASPQVSEHTSRGDRSASRELFQVANKLSGQRRLSDSNAPGHRPPRPVGDRDDKHMDETPTRTPRTPTLSFTSAAYQAEAQVDASENRQLSNSPVDHQVVSIENNVVRTDVVDNIGTPDEAPSMLLTRRPSNDKDDSDGSTEQQQDVLVEQAPSFAAPDSSAMVTNNNKSGKAPLVPILTSPNASSSQPTPKSGAVPSDKDTTTGGRSRTKPSHRGGTASVGTQDSDFTKATSPRYDNFAVPMSPTVGSGLIVSETISQLEHMVAPRTLSSAVASTCPHLRQHADQSTHDHDIPLPIIMQYSLPSHGTPIAQHHQQQPTVGKRSNNATPTGGLSAASGHVSDHGDGSPRGPTVGHDDKNVATKLLDGDKLQLALNVLDRTPTADTHKIGVVYIGPGQSMEDEFHANHHGSARYVAMLKGLGTLIRLDEETPVFTGGLDRIGGLNGEYAIHHWSPISETIYYVSTLMPSPAPGDISEGASPTLLHKKRLLGNVYVTIAYTDANQDVSLNTFSGQFCYVLILVYPIRDGFHRVVVKRHPDVPMLGPISDSMLVPDSALGEVVRETAFIANTAATVIVSGELHYFSNWRERLEQVRRAVVRLSVPSNGIQQQSNALLTTLPTLRKRPLSRNKSTPSTSASPNSNGVRGHDDRMVTSLDERPSSIDDNAAVASTNTSRRVSPKLRLLDRLLEHADLEGTMTTVTDGCSGLPPLELTAQESAHSAQVGQSKKQPKQNHP